jgi:hypothetical protein
MAYGNLLADVVQSSVTGSPPQFNDGTGAQIGTICRAWVSFNGTTSPPTIRGSFNISSVTKSGAGTYTINITSAMPDTNYSVVGQGSYSGGTDGRFQFEQSTARTTTAYYMYTANASQAATDSLYGNIAIFR